VSTHHRTGIAYELMVDLALGLARPVLRRGHGPAPGKVGADPPDADIPAKPASVKPGTRVLPGFEPAGAGRAATDNARADFNAATDGWFFDAADRKGVLHVKIAPQRLATGFSVTIGMYARVRLNRFPDADSPY